MNLFKLKPQPALTGTFPGSGFVSGAMIKNADINLMLTDPC